MGSLAKANLCSKVPSRGTLGHDMKSTDAQGPKYREGQYFKSEPTTVMASGRMSRCIAEERFIFMENWNEVTIWKLQYSVGGTYHKFLSRRILQEANDTSNSVYMLTCK